MNKPIGALLALLLAVTPAWAQTVGWTPVRESGLSTTVQAVRPNGGRIGMVQCYNPNGSVAYVQIFNSAPASVTLGTTPSVLSVPIAPTSTGGFPQTEAGINISGPISVAATTTATGAGTPSTALDCNFTVF